MNFTGVEALILLVMFALQAFVVLAILAYIKRRRSIAAAPLGEGWHPDPRGSAALRWFDGTAWTEHVHANPAHSEVDR